MPGSSYLSPGSPDRLSNHPLKEDFCPYVAFVLLDKSAAIDWRCRQNKWVVQNLQRGLEPLKLEKILGVKVARLLT